MLSGRSASTSHEIQPGLGAAVSEPVISIELGCQATRRGLTLRMGLVKAGRDYRYQMPARGPSLGDP